MNTYKSRVAGATLGVAAAALVTGAIQSRRWIAHWGATEAELAQPLPGDTLVRTPLACVTRAMTIDAPAAALWPWIAQMGSEQLGRAGWYSYDRFDNGGVPSLDRVRPEIPAPQEGDVLVPDPAFAWTVREVCPGSHLLLELTSPPGRFKIHTTWILAVQPMGASRCRLVERSWWDMRPRVLGVPFSLVFEFVDFAMMRRHLLNVRSRATAVGVSPDPVTIDGVALNARAGQRGIKVIGSPNRTLGRET